MAINEPQFQNYIKEVFRKYGSDYADINKKLQSYYKDNSRKRDELEALSHFYYFICSPRDDSAREELQIVGMTSLIEAMMSETEFKDVFEYFDFINPNKNTINDFNKFKKEYLEQYGATKKIREYFNNFVSKEEAELLIKKIQVWDNKIGDFKNLKNTDDLAKLLYQMRNDFVHCAEMRFFCSTKNTISLLEIGKKCYSVEVNIFEILNLFEKSYVKYWNDKVSHLYLKKQ